MEIMIMFIVGLIIGCGISSAISKSNVIGSIRIDSSDPNDEPYLFLELARDKNVDSIYQKSYIMLKVDVADFVTHK